MYTRRLHPKKLSLAQLDQYLAKGWYRMNQMIFTVYYLYTDLGIFSPVWLRYNLSQFNLGKSLRKVNRKNNEAFSCRISPVNLDKSHESLYELYRSEFDGTLSPKLFGNLMGEDRRNIFTTYMVEVFDEDKLIAFSVFDIGETSAASILGIYHPSYKANSLGLYTMIKEIEWAQRNNKQFFYPGYFVPGWPRFDYKLRYGNPDFYDPYVSQWRSIVSFDKDKTPIHMLRAALEQAQNYLAQVGLGSKIIFYPFFEEDLEPLGYDQDQVLRTPLILVLDAHILNMRTVIAVQYDLRAQAYALHQYVALPLLDTVYTKEHTENYRTDLVCLAYLVEGRSIKSPVSLQELANSI